MTNDEARMTNGQEPKWPAARFFATRPHLPILSIPLVLPPMMRIEGTARQRGWHFLRP
jgi:hypothetical protein